MELDARARDRAVSVKWESSSPEDVPRPSKWCTGHKDQIVLPGLQCPSGEECDGERCWIGWEQGRRREGDDEEEDVMLQS